jgi:hypothetical protein
MTHTPLSAPSPTENVPASRVNHTCDASADLCQLSLYDALTYRTWDWYEALPTASEPTPTMN